MISLSFKGVNSALACIDVFHGVKMYLKGGAIFRAMVNLAFR